MSISNEHFYEDHIDEMVDIQNMDLTGIENDLLDDIFGPSQVNEVNMPNTSTPLSTLYSSHMDSSSMTSFTDLLTYESLQMVAQPFQSSKLRYRADYNREKGRLGALKNKTQKFKNKGPAISILKCYLNSSDEYYIRVSLVTTKYQKTNVHYFHPYELEDAKSETVNDRANNSVWFPIGARDSIKHFPFLRIVKKKVLDTQKLDRLRIFDYYNELFQSTCDSHHYLHRKLDIIKEFNLVRSQLAFTLGRKVVNGDQVSMHIYPNTTIFSEPMDENDDKQTDTDSDTDSSVELASTLSSYQYIYKYAPKRSTFGGDDDEMLIFLKKRLEAKKYGDLQVIFEGDTSKGHWSQSVIDVNIKDRMMSFKIPNYPETIVNPTSVDIILRQEHRTLGILKYSYLPLYQ